MHDQQRWARLRLLVEQLKMWSLEPQHFFIIDRIMFDILIAEIERVIQEYYDEEETHS